MSAILNMARVSQMYGGNDALGQAQNWMKNQLQIENGINKNWQDARTFERNVNAINAANAQKEAEANKAYNQIKENESMLAQYAANAFAPDGRLRSMAELGRIAAENGNLGVYGGWQNAQNARQAGIDESRYLAGIDPVAAANAARNAGLYGGANIGVTQSPNGQVAIRNSSGYTANYDPALGGMAIADPTKTAGTMATWNRQDVVDVRNHEQAKDRAAFQSDLNYANTVRTTDYKINQAMPAEAAMREEIAKKYAKNPEQQMFDTADVTKHSVAIFQDILKNNPEIASDKAKMDAAAQQARNIAIQVMTGYTGQSGQPQASGNQWDALYQGLGQQTPQQAAPVQQPSRPVAVNPPLAQYFNTWRQPVDVRQSYVEQPVYRVGGASGGW